ncbi:MAG: putative quinol monooxygenase [Pseudomonadota bacterium]
MFVITVTFKIAPENIKSFKALMYAQARNSLELEPDCHQFDVCEDGADPGTIFLYELYTDEAAFQLHLASEHFKQFDRDVAPMVLDKQVRSFVRTYPA